MYRIEYFPYHNEKDRYTLIVGSSAMRINIPIDTNNCLHYNVSFYDINEPVDILDYDDYDNPSWRRFAYVEGSCIKIWSTHKLDPESATKSKTHEVSGTYEIWLQKGTGNIIFKKISSNVCDNILN